MNEFDPRLTVHREHTDIPAPSYEVANGVKDEYGTEVFNFTVHHIKAGEEIHTQQVVESLGRLANRSIIATIEFAGSALASNIFTQLHPFVAPLGATAGASFAVFVFASYKKSYKEGSL